MLSQEAIQFIDDLKANNATEWMHANKKRYEIFKKEYHAYIALLLDAMKPLDKSLENLEIKNCTFRINRDIRFSKNKDPYKTNIGVWMSTNKNRKNSPGYYIHFEKRKSFIAGGIWCPEPNDLKTIRKEIEFFHEDLDKIVHEKKFVKEFSGLDYDGNTVLKNAPKGFDGNHPAIEFLKLKSFTATQQIEEAAFSKENFADLISKKLIALQPLNKFLKRALETNE